ncbi:hypothetical protein WN55_00784 [Dufourea novaeangliae]|uniref:Uncharacterized protein n=1 Tax=Dufourea novaeangliae TaxID=178035 RepID=A0A154PCV5_DUFNO|nr:hypothetical protein WN55_00784 [Dufourea novaeangliae]
MIVEEFRRTKGRSIFRLGPLITEQEIHDQLKQGTERIVDGGECLLGVNSIDRGSRRP